MKKGVKIFAEMIKIIIKFRSLLQRNKIFFEVFSYLVIGIAGVYFSYSQWDTNRKQVAMQKSEMQPVFRITFTLYKDSLSGVYNTEMFEIYNDGKPIKSFNYKIDTYYEIEHISQEKNIKRTCFIPILGFYWAQFPTDNFMGKLSSGFLTNNNLECDRVYQECMQQSKGTEFYFINKFSLIKIDYKDLNDALHSVYFKDRMSISLDVYNELFIKPKELKTDIPIDVDKVTLDIIKEQYMK
jgi:hypothetical protein